MQLEDYLSCSSYEGVEYYILFEIVLDQELKAITNSTECRAFILNALILVDFQE